MERKKFFILSIIFLFLISSLPFSLAQAKVAEVQKKPLMIKPSSQTVLSKKLEKNACAPDEESVKALKDLRKKLEELQEKGETQAAEEIQKRIEALEKDMAAKREECLKKLGKGKLAPIAPKIKEVVRNYHQKMKEILTSDKTPQEKAEALKNIEKDLGHQIREVVKSVKEVDYKDIKPLVKKIIVRKGRIILDKQPLTVNKEKILRVSINGKKVGILVRSKEVELNQGKIKVRVLRPVTVDNGKVIIGKKRILLTPLDLVRKARLTSQAQITLKEDKGKPIYEAIDRQKKRLLGIFPVRVKKEVVVDASVSGGKIIKQKRPWWSFLAF